MRHMPITHSKSKGNKLKHGQALGHLLQHSQAKLINVHQNTAWPMNTVWNKAQTNKHLIYLVKVKTAQNCRKPLLIYTTRKAISRMDRYCSNFGRQTNIHLKSD